MSTANRNFITGVRRRYFGGGVFESSVINFIGLALPILLQLITVPIYLKIIGPERYAVLSLTWLLLGNFGFFDLGFGRAVTSRLAAQGGGHGDGPGRLVGTGIVLSLVAGGVGGLALAPASWIILNHTLNVPADILGELTWIPLLLGLAMPMLTLLSVLSGALQGCQRFLDLNLGQSIGSVLYQLFPLLVAVGCSRGLSGLVAAALLGRFLSLIALAWFCRRAVPALRSGLRFDPGEARGLLKFGSWITAGSMLGTLLWSVDRLFIGMRLTAAAVTVYIIPSTLMERAIIIPGALFNVLFPKFAALEEQEARALLSANVYRLAAIATLIVMLGLLLLRPFLDLWIGKSFGEQSAPLGEALLIGLWFSFNSFIPFAFLQGRGRPDLVARACLLQAVVYLPLQWFIIGHFGLIGAAWTWTARLAAHNLLLFHGADLQAALLRLVPGLTLVLILFLAVHLTVPGLMVRLVGAVAVVAAMAVWFGGGAIRGHVAALRRPP
ncbi:flippase [Nitrospirillum iridis]|uniref:O-antigen/teichoic acid export membrane protein n=1 Tax=Nitrospirillum iridis TaxID=765888 RepID=A0A7X0B118_9PROT|nr:flippase [Nitrospirillum iridis]MBB6253700.1 O-antigen/teichoic acid export membrane protein [Nitrospirillum iridis]